MSQTNKGSLTGIEGVLQAYKAGNLNLAYQRCQAELAMDNQNPALLQFYGLLAIELEDYVIAEETFIRLLEFQPLDATVWAGLAQAEEGTKKYLDALNHYLQAIQLSPECFEALLGVASILKQDKQYELSLEYYQKALDLEPSFDALSGLGSLLIEMDRAEEALVYLKQAKAIAPQDAKVHYNLSVAYRKLNDLDAVKSYLEEAVQIDPGFAEAHYQLGIVNNQLADYDAELTCYEQAVIADPSLVASHIRLGLIYSVQGNIDKAKKAYQILSKLEPESSVWKLRLASMIPIIMPNHEAIIEHRQNIESIIEELEKEADPKPEQSLGQSFAIPPYHWLYHGVDDTDLRGRFADCIARRMELDNYKPIIEPIQNRKLKIGFLCTEYRESAFWTLQGGFIERLNLEAFEVVIFGTTKTLPELKKRLASTTDIKFIDFAIDIPMIVQAIRQESLDVLHFFEVGSDPLNYFLAFHRMAPVQCTSWGILSTTGISTMDYYLSSAWFEPENAKKHYREELILFEHSLAYYEEPKKPDVFLSRLQLGLPEDKHIYSCPHSLFKFHPEFDGYLEAVLHKDPDGVIVLNKSTNELTTQLLQERLQKTIPAVYSRIIFLPFLNWEEYMSLIDTSDVLLDPIHFGGGVTSYNAFSLGVPIVTQPSLFLRGRVTSGMYQIMGITDTIVNSKEEYINKCYELATNPEKRKQISEKILESKQKLFNDQGMVSDLEKFFKQAVQKAWKVQN